MILRLALIVAALLAGSAGRVFAEGPQYSGTCASISWLANTETDLAGYRLYDRTSQALPKTRIRTYGIQITSATCASIGMNPGQHYLSLTSIDTTGNESTSTAEIPFVIVVDNQVTDLRVTSIGATDMTLAFTEVNDGLNAPASYDVRVKTPTMDWGTAASVTAGTCSTPVAGVTIGATKTCTVTGLTTTTPYEFQLVPFRGTIGVNAVYGPLSNVTGATTGGSIDDLGDRTVIASFTFTQSDGALTSPWEGGYNNGAPTTNLQVVGNEIRATNTTVDSTMMYNVALPTDQWCEMKISTMTGTGVRAPRCVLAANTPGLLSAYEFTALVGVSTVKSRITERTNGQSAATNLAEENTTTWVTGDVLRAEKRGSQLALFRNGTQLLTATDSSFTGGRGGITIYSGAAVANVEVDDVKFGTFSVGAGDTCGCDQH